MNRRSSIGFDRKIHLEWLDATAAQIEAGGTGPKVRDFLFCYLSHLAGGRKHGSARSKTVGVLTRIWLNVPPEAQPLRARALELLPDIDAGDRVILHWTMTIAAYPFFSDMASVVGRILGLQDTFTLSHVERRISDLWGERSTVKRTCQYAIRSMVEWHVLEDVGKGVYRRAAELHDVDGELALLLMEGFLLDLEDESISLKQAINHPAFFPFDIEVNPTHIHQSARIRVFRQGLDEDRISLPHIRAP